MSESIFTRLGLSPDAGAEEIVKDYCLADDYGELPPEWFIELLTAIEQRGRRAGIEEAAKVADADVQKMRSDDLFVSGNAAVHAAECTGRVIAKTIRALLGQRGEGKG